MISIDDCRIEWQRESGCLRVLHLPTGRFAERRNMTLREAWKLDELLEEIEKQETTK